MVKKCAITMYIVAMLLCLVTLAGCGNTAQSELADVPKKELADVPKKALTDRPERVAEVGQIPEDFVHIVEKDLFDDAVAFGDRLLKAESLERTEESRSLSHHIQMMDLYGNELATYRCTSPDAYSVATLTATKDGGFLFVLGFHDYAYDQDTWASDNGFASRIIKCDQEGTLLFDTALEAIEGWALQYCFEVNEHFYFFGTTETVKTKTRGVVSPSDIFMAVLDRNGAVVSTRCIGGSDFDMLHGAEMSENTFILSISAQSSDGDFTGSPSKGYPHDWVFTLNYDLEILGKEMKTGRDYFDTRLGEKDGTPIYASDALLTDFDAGTPKVFMDYGDFYLIVSTNATGVYEKTPPTVSSIWYYTESVYSAYDSGGKLIFRASVDSSPDYDVFVQEYNTVS